VSASTGTTQVAAGVAIEKEASMITNHGGFAGIDWASQKHQSLPARCAGKILARSQFAHSGTGLAELSIGCGHSHGQPAISTCHRGLHGL